MAKVVAEKPTSKDVKFLVNWEGNYNGFEIRVRKGQTRQLPPAVYEWIQKFQVCHDA